MDTTMTLQIIAGLACALLVAPTVPQVPALNISTRKVGGLRFLKIGRLCVSFCVTREYRPL